MDRLLAVAARTGQTRIVVADLLHRRAGDNPHLWYDPAAMPALTRALAAALMENDPSGRDAIAVRAAKTLASLAVLQTRIDSVRQRVAGLPVAAH